MMCYKYMTTRIHARQRTPALYRSETARVPWTRRTCTILFWQRPIRGLQVDSSGCPLRFVARRVATKAKSRIFIAQLNESDRLPVNPGKRNTWIIPTRCHLMAIHEIITFVLESIFRFERIFRNQSSAFFLKNRNNTYLWKYKIIFYMIFFNK